VVFRERPRRDVPAALPRRALALTAACVGRTAKPTEGQQDCCSSYFEDGLLALQFPLQLPFTHELHVFFLCVIRAMRLRRELGDAPRPS
jgi:hypothetical protein